MPEPDIREARVRPGGPPGLTGAALTTCVEAAIAAPSIYNSQPWRFRVRDDGIDVFADWGRRLDVIDPSGRELLISVGAAVFNLRLTMRQYGRTPVLHLPPDAAQPDLVARVVPGPPATPDPSLTALAAAIPRRHTNRRPFARTVVPASVLEELATAAQAEGAMLRVADPVGRGAILSLVRTAERRLRAQGVYRAELTERTPAAHGRSGGVPPNAFGPWDAMEALPLRDFGLTQPLLRRGGERFEPYPTIVVLSTAGDTPQQWLRAGQALQRVLLTATVAGLASTPMSQPLELPRLRRLVTDTAAGQWAQVILRLGYGQPTTPTPRRPLAEVLITPAADPDHT
ncbi:nitroreductase family protein [Dactylosporangium sp. NBC_01737]|uniref:Acg family FMN-binding oxidoreductase n=1 Tax=Dactylosporangium sp. NBC_01737 TaxID=2975959 RepID=UPI002E164553|nr:nitroreductase family protein [Dactylosporangium sp. NBC_01737]